MVQELKTLYGEQTYMGSENKSPPKDDDGKVSNEEREIILKIDEAVVKSSKPAIYIVGIEQNQKSIRQSLWSKEFVKQPEHIHKVSKPAKDPVPNKWKEAGLHGEWQSLPVSHQCQEETNEGVDDPAMQAPQFNLVLRCNLDKPTSGRG